MLALSPNSFSSGFRSWNLDNIDIPTFYLDQQPEQQILQVNCDNYFINGGYSSGSPDQTNLHRLHHHHHVVDQTQLVGGGGGGGMIIGTPPTTTTVTGDQMSPVPAHYPAAIRATDNMNNNNNNLTSSTTLPKSVTAKKINHNASERDRRRRINTLYSSLRSVLPQSEHTKKLSIPATVSRVLKYIPELQKEVEELNRKKEELFPKNSDSDSDSDSDRSYYQDAGKGATDHNRNRNCNIQRASSSSSPNDCSSASVHATQISTDEIMIQISTLKSMQQQSTVMIMMMPFSDVLREIEEDHGVVVANVSSFESSESGSGSAGGRVFYNLHLQLVAEGTQLAKYKCDAISEKILCCYQKWEALCRWILS